MPMQCPCTCTCLCSCTCPCPCLCTCTCLSPCTCPCTCPCLYPCPCPCPCHMQMPMPMPIHMIMHMHMPMLMHMPMPMPKPSQGPDDKEDEVFLGPLQPDHGSVPASLDEQVGPASPSRVIFFDDLSSLQPDPQRVVVSRVPLSVADRGCPSTQPLDAPACVVPVSKRGRRLPPPLYGYAMPSLTTEDVDVLLNGLNSITDERSTPKVSRACSTPMPTPLPTPTTTTLSDAFLRMDDHVCSSSFEFSLLPSGSDLGHGGYGGCISPTSSVLPPLSSALPRRGSILSSIL